MSFKRGQAAKDSINQQKNNDIDLKKVYVKLKDGDSVRVRLLSDEDYIEYKAHGSFNHGIWTTPCLREDGEACALCEANDAKIDDYDDLYAKKRYLFAFADIDSSELRVFDATKTQAKSLIKTIEQYSEDVAETAFTFSRSGNKTETSYTLNPILRLKGDDVERFGKFEGQTVSDEFFDTVLQKRTREQMIQDLGKAKFPIEDVFGVSVAAGERKDDVKPVEGDEPLPF